MAYKYLSKFPRPVLDDLIKGRWLPIIGAGMSLNAVLPKGKKMPLWGELGKQLEKDLSDYEPNSPIDAASAYEHRFDRARLLERLSELLHVHSAQPGEAHEHFAPFRLE